MSELIGCLVGGLCDISDKTRVKTCDEEFILWRVHDDALSTSQQTPTASSTTQPSLIIPTLSTTAIYIVQAHQKQLVDYQHSVDGSKATCYTTNVTVSPRASSRTENILCGEHGVPTAIAPTTIWLASKYDVTYAQHRLSHPGAKVQPTKRAKQASKGEHPAMGSPGDLRMGSGSFSKPTGFTPPGDFFLTLVTVSTRRSAPYLLPTGQERSTWKPERSCGWWSYIQSK
ncbi:uncharacterized protein N7518_006551 [Penicillium psychrosexuale]|uniref:uncharacterized protein n=1 Tax=Penicillium psychrosexuale TaxID=1002107 RepID=UPI002544E1B8|nr:uncharacterized protein N7518_006551 [Penicillium psychrosexuale]KAJ5789540.1 hypothetical protein N7518_006551 [Penicillium psychrosexuale]